MCIIGPLPGGAMFMYDRHICCYYVAPFFYIARGSGFTVHDFGPHIHTVGEGGAVYMNEP